MTEILCKTIIDGVMPSVRASIAIKMLDSGIKQTEISRRLGLTQPAISQYKHGLRGEMLNNGGKNTTMQSYINQLFRDVVDKGLDINTKTCEICKISTESSLISANNGAFLRLCEISKRK